VALSTYTELKAAVATLLNRTDLTTPIVDFITLAESEIKRKLRRTKARASYTISETTWTLPSEIGELLSIRLDTGSPSLDKPIPIVTSFDGDTHLARLADTAGRPEKAYIVGRKVVLIPTPDTSYNIEVTYVASLTALSDSNASNTVLEEAPDVYLYGAAVHSAPYLGDDARLPLWRQFFESAIGELNLKREHEEFGGNPKSATPSRTFG
jgi:hypothetical protein